MHIIYTCMHLTIPHHATPHHTTPHVCVYVCMYKYMYAHMYMHRYRHRYRYFDGSRTGDSIRTPPPFAALAADGYGYIYIYT